MRANCLWVLVADEDKALICLNEDGHTSFLRSVVNARLPVQRESARLFALELIAQLSKGVLAEEFDGLMIVATPRMMTHLRACYTPAIKRLLVSEIVQDLPRVDLNGGNGGLNA